MLRGFMHNRNLNYPDTTTLQQYTANTYTNPLHGYRLQADYAVTIGPGKLESGYLWKYQKQNGNSLTPVQDSGTGDLVTQSDNVTDVRNNIQSIRKNNFKIGLGRITVLMRSNWASPKVLIVRLNWLRQAHPNDL